MQNQSHLFNPKDDTFQERIRSYKTVLHAYSNMEACLDRMNDKEWSDRLGSTEELGEAQVIVDNSLKIAMTSIKPSEIRKAEAQGLLTPQDLVLLERIERQQEMQSARAEKQATLKNQHKQSR